MFTRRRAADLSAALTFAVLLLLTPRAGSQPATPGETIPGEAKPAPGKRDDFKPGEDKPFRRAPGAPWAGSDPVLASREILRRLEAEGALRDQDWKTALSILQPLLRAEQPRPSGRRCDTRSASGSKETPRARPGGKRKADVKKEPFPPPPPNRFRILIRADAR